jgi:hypothetical protein
MTNFIYSTMLEEELEVKVALVIAVANGVIS